MSEDQDPRGNVPHSPAHHAAFNVALEQAVQVAANGLDVGESKDYVVKFSIKVERTNPGAVRDYVVTLTPLS